MNERWGNTCAALWEAAAPTPDEITYLHRMGRQQSGAPDWKRMCFECRMGKEAGLSPASPLDF